jgi:outer membrane biosynthesis protein TonB
MASEEPKSPLPLPLDEKPGRPERRPLDWQGLVAGLCLAILVNGGGLLVLWRATHRVDRPKLAGPEVFVDVKLLKFGRKRDLSFLPHVDVTPRTAQKNTLKLAQDPDKPSQKREDKKPEALAKLTDLARNLRADDDERASRAALEEGDPNGVHGGTASEAAGDPYLREIVAAVLERWTVPTMLKPEDLAKLQAAACLTIDDDGNLRSFRIVEASGNPLFDGSLNTTLGSLKTLPRPHGRFAQAARTGRLCPVFSKQ